MKHGFKYSLLLLIILTAGCNIEEKTDDGTKQIATVFPKG